MEPIEAPIDFIWLAWLAHFDIAGPHTGLKCGRVRDDNLTAKTELACSFRAGSLRSGRASGMMG